MRIHYTIPAEEVELTAIRAQGAGGLPETIRDRLLSLRDQRISKEGVVVIKAQEFRSLEKNRAEAMRRLEELVSSVAATPRKRRPTKPTRSSIAKRLEYKARHAQVKAGRRSHGIE